MLSLKTGPYFVDAAACRLQNDLWSVAGGAIAQPVGGSPIGPSRYDHILGTLH